MKPGNSLPVIRTSLLTGVTLACLVMPLAYGGTQTMSDGPITKENLLSALESMQARKSKRQNADWYVARIKEHKVNFRPTSEDEQKIRLNGRYLGKKGLGTLIAAVRDNYRPDVPPQPVLEQPTFGSNIEKAIFTIGGNSYIIPTEALRKGPINLIRLEGQDVVVAYVEGNKLYADVTIYGDPSLRAIELKRNQFLVRPPRWDYNSNDRTFEVVNEKGIPIFQLYYKTASNIVINGVFPFPNLQDGVVYLSELGTHKNNPAHYNVKPIFKYPSWKYPGQYADETPTALPTPPPVRKLNYSQEVVSSKREDAPYAVKVVIHTNVAIHPTSLVVKCDSEFATAEYQVLGASTLMQAGDGHVGDKTAFWFFFAEPAFRPEHTVVILLMAKQPIRVLDVLEGPPLPR